MRNRIILILSLCCTICIGQSEGVVVKIGTSATSRIISLNKDLTSEEKSMVRDLERMTLSFQSEIGYSFEGRDGKSLQLGIGYRFTRFGTKIYQIGKGVPNVTPQYGYIKEVVQQSQFAAYLQLDFKRFRSVSPFVKSSLLFNRNYSIRTIDYDDDKKRGFVGSLNFQDPNTNLLDLNLCSGVNYIAYRTIESKITVQPYVSVFLGSRNISRSYLNLGKETSGYLWDVGISLQYNM